MRIWIWSLVFLLPVLPACQEGPGGDDDDNGDDDDATGDDDTGDDDTGDDDDGYDEIITLTIPLGVFGEDLPIGPGVSQFTLPVELPPDVPTLDLLSIDIADSLQYAVFEPDSPSATAERIAEFQVHIAALGDPDPCGNGECWGNFRLDEDGSGGVTADPTEAAATENTLQVINGGGFDACVDVQTDQPGTLDVTHLTVSYSEQDPDCPDPVDFNGEWTGTYWCDDTCWGKYPPEPITLWVEQDGHDATYTDDGSGVYSGTVCGNVFTFTGAYSDEIIESGQLVLNPDGTATKTSEYDDDCCTGHCEDQLERTGG